MTDQLALTVNETARKLSVSAHTVRRMINAGQLRAIRVRGRVLVPVSAVESLTEAA